MTKTPNRYSWLNSDANDLCLLLVWQAGKKEFQFALQYSSGSPEYKKAKASDQTENTIAIAL
jgi:hypothetical protein